MSVLILAIDIGGTYSRFAQINSTSLEPMGDVTRIATRQTKLNSFTDLLEDYLQHTGSTLDWKQLKAVSVAVPGPVYGSVCYPPNIPWQIDISPLQQRARVFMLNDFAAQGYACLLADIQNPLVTLRPGQDRPMHRFGVIGAGTGLGHCLIIKQGTHTCVVPSEAGHACASFHGAQERALEDFLKQRLNVDYVVNDHLINGRGIVLLHEFLTGETLTAEQIFASNQQQQSVDMFARFYGRVCRNYVLANCLEGLIISGGLAAKNPQLLESSAFNEELDHLTTEDYRPLLQNLSLKLNRRDDLGLLGAASYAVDQLNAEIAAS